VSSATVGGISGLSWTSDINTAADFCITDDVPGKIYKLHNPRVIVRVYEYIYEETEYLVDVMKSPQPEELVFPDEEVFKMAHQYHLVCGYVDKKRMTGFQTDAYQAFVQGELCSPACSKITEKT
jgi:hypothetical protein